MNHFRWIVTMLFVFIWGVMALRPLYAQDMPETGIYFSADITRPTNALRRIDLNGNNDNIIIGALPVNQVIYIESENKIYGAGLDNAIRRMNPDGTGVETLVAGLNGANSLRIDLDGAKMYWIDEGSAFLERGSEIWRANLDGSQQERIIDSEAGFGQFNGLTLDPAGGKLLVVNDDEILWANLDGSDPGVFAMAQGGVNPELSCILVDAVNDQVYWVQDGGSQDSAIYRANRDGTDSTPIIPLSTFPSITCPILDATNSELLWGDEDVDSILRGDLDGSNVDALLTDVGNVVELRLGEAGRLYWRERIANGRFNLVGADRDGGNRVTYVTELQLVRAFEVISALARLFYINQNDQIMELGTATLKDDVEADLVLAGPRDIRGIGIDQTGGKAYFTNGPAIARVNLDGTGFETIVTETASAEVLTLDLENGKVYWSIGAPTPAIRRANLNGTGVEDVFVHPGGGTSTIFRGITLDRPVGKLYWAYYIFGGSDPYSGSIWQADLDGGNAEPLITGLTNPIGVGLDSAGGKIYWTDAGTRKIQRANLADGSEVEDVISVGLQRPEDLVVDAPNGHLYFSDSAATTISRATLEGEAVTTLYDGPASPYSLVVFTNPPDGGEEPDGTIYLPALSAD